MLLNAVLNVFKNRIFVNHQVLLWQRMVMRACQSCGEKNLAGYKLCQSCGMFSPGSTPAPFSLLALHSKLPPHLN